MMSYVEIQYRAYKKMASKEQSRQEVLSKKNGNDATKVNFTS